ncbi:MAG: adenosylcobinamide-GDP ribazoletransferase [Steroidobacteraceae bacterium]
MSTLLRCELQRLLMAVQYFTRIPMPRWVGHSQGQLNAATRYFPAVGLLVGASGAATCWIASFALPVSVAVLLSMAGTIFLTGAFHEDGLADAFDGLGGGYTREHSLAIMKDSRIGTYGAVALVLVLLTKFECLNAMPAATQYAAMIAGHATSRGGAVMVMAALPYVRENDASRAKPLVQRVSRASLGVAGFTAIVPALSLTSAGLLGLATAAVAVGLWIAQLRRRLGGYTGDCLGATQQLAEIAFYLGVVAASR